MPRSFYISIGKDDVDAVARISAFASSQASQMFFDPNPPMAILIITYVVGVGVHLALRLVFEHGRRRLCVHGECCTFDDMYMFIALACQKCRSTTFSAFTFDSQMQIY